jgi:hypothetical protein
MKKFLNLSLAIVFALSLTGLTNAQETPVVPKPAEKPVPPTEETDAVQTYDVPLIGRDDLTDGKAKLNAALEGMSAEAFIEANEDGSTQVRIAMNSLDKIAKGKTYAVWLAGEDETYTKIGEIVYAADQKSAELSGKVPTDTFGIFITSEDGQVEKPTSKTYTAFTPDTGE